MRRILVMFGLLAARVTGADVAGRVIDSSTGEPLVRVRVELAGVRVATNLQGGFTLPGIPAGEHELRVSTVGYRPFSASMTVNEEAPFVEVALFPETLRRSERVTVTAGAFAEDAPTAVGLVGNELKNLASVLADDPLRAVQALPGVVANDDFQSQFAIRGAPYDRVGLYLNGVLLHSPFHGIEGDASSASLTMFNGDILETVSLYAGAPPPAFGDRTAGALDARTREGDRNDFSVRATASASNAGALAEGPLPGGRGSWLAAARKSYLQYLLERTSDDPSLSFAFTDVQARLAYQFSKAHQLSMSIAQGWSGLDRRGYEERFGLNAIVTSAYRSTLADMAWRFAPSPSLLASNRVIYLREHFANENRRTDSLGEGAYGEWAWYGDASVVWGGAATLSFGGSARRVRDDGFLNQFLSTTLAPRRLEQYRGAATRAGGYVQQSWSWWNGRVQASAGGRWDRHSVSGRNAWSPYASLGWHPRPATRLQFSWGHYTQFPEIIQLFSLSGRPTLLPQRAIHYVATFEQRLNQRTRLRVELYDREDRDLLFRPADAPRLMDGRIVDPPLYPPWENSQRGHARGLEVMLQRRTANGLTGWLAYGFSRATVRDGLLHLEYPADYDLRHSVTAFLSYRLRPSVNLSGRTSYGSGLPGRAFLEVRDGQFFLSANRNQLRLPAYARTDARINKMFVRDSWQLTLFAEVINMFNRRNVRFTEMDSYDPRTGRARPQIDRTFPILPSAGVVIEF